MPEKPFHAARNPLLLRDRPFAKNRLYFAPMGLDLCDASGTPGDEFLSQYTRFLKGGFGFGFMGNSSVDTSVGYNQRGHTLVASDQAEKLSPLFELSRHLNVPLGVQLQHYGAQGIPRTPEAPLMTPSGHISSSTRRRVPQTQARIMSEGDIWHIIALFLTSARYAVGAGCRLIQIQASNGYLISSFLSPATNTRDDEWGGTPLRRARFLVELVRKLRQVLPDDVDVTVRIGVDDGLGEDGQLPELLGDVVPAVAEAGASAIACSVGIAETFSKFFSSPDDTIACLRKAVRLLKRNTPIPMGFTGSLTSLLQAEAILESGDADFIGFARAALANPNLVNADLSGFNPQQCKGDAFCFRDKREEQATRVYCCVNPSYRRPEQLQTKYEESRQ